jgi:hypothetical protein
MLLKIFSSGGPMLLNNSGRKGPYLLKTDNGMFVRSPAGRLAFHAACGPSDAEVAQVLGTIRRRVGRLLRRRGLEPDADSTGQEDPVAETSLALAGILGASVRGGP